jgi:hypothetical protein
MHDTLDERLARLGGDLEDTAEVRSPALMRSRGEQFRVAHRRRMMAVTAASAAVAVIGVGSLVTFRGGQRDQPVSPGATVSSSASAPASQPAVVAQPTAVVDLARLTMTVYDKDHRVLKTIPVTAGTAKHPSRPGTFAVTEKNDELTLDSASTTGTDGYSVVVKWAVWLDGNGPLLFATPWDVAKLGRIDGSHGQIGMSTEDAEWFYDHVEAGDRIQIR